MITTAATKENIELLTQTQVKERGWTATLVEKFLSAPDKTKTNPWYRSAAPMKLYAKERVEAIEATSEFQQARAKASVRSQATKKVAARRIAGEFSEGTARGEQVPVTVRRLTLEEVRREAIAAYNAYQATIFSPNEPATDQSDVAFLDRITVNYIRHHLTTYDENLPVLRHEIGRVARVGQNTMRRRIYDEISRVYPEYAEECHRQLELREYQEALVASFR